MRVSRQSQASCAPALPLPGGALLPLPAHAFGETAHRPRTIPAAGRKGGSRKHRRHGRCLGNVGKPGGLPNIYTLQCHSDRVFNRPRRQTGSSSWFPRAPTIICQVMTAPFCGTARPPNGCIADRSRPSQAVGEPSSGLRGTSLGSWMPFAWYSWYRKCRPTELPYTAHRGEGRCSPPAQPRSATTKHATPFVF